MDAAGCLKVLGGEEDGVGVISAVGMGSLPDNIHRSDVWVVLTDRK